MRLYQNLADVRIEETTLKGGPVEENEACFLPFPCPIYSQSKQTMRIYDKNNRNLEWCL